MLKQVFILILVLITSGIVMAETNFDDQGNPNEPIQNDSANACYEGGSMDGKCDTTWEWQCGWHLIRFEYNLTSREDFPTWCISIIPPEIISEDSIPQAQGCKLRGTLYLQFGDGYFLPARTPAFNDANCIDPAGAITVLPVVYAPAPYDALTRCNLNGTYSSVQLWSNDIYKCRR